MIGTAAYLTLIGVLGSALGWILRSTPGGLVGYVAIILVLPVIFGNVLGTWGKHVAEYFPSQAGGAFVSSLPEQPSLSPWAGFGVLCAWVVAAVALAAWLLRRRDV